ncbi:hypothetical protein Q8A67_022823 [Cirrhinus molitorella]|uniref:Uncharacterized protein n=1 Tax=Cirrhinus molitorella TaxID=172907 RepID=A0AA88TBD7_9TELE|nr:hypothetical protein Q8A67_022823 [Cirrhinus molitorella]
MLDSMSLAVSEMEELSGSINDPTTLPSSEPSGSRAGTGIEAARREVLGARQVLVNSSCTEPTPTYQSSSLECWRSGHLQHDVPGRTEEQGRHFGHSAGNPPSDAVIDI